MKRLNFYVIFFLTSSMAPFVVMWTEVNSFLFHIFAPKMLFMVDKTPGQWTITYLPTVGTSTPPSLQKLSHEV
jgi:hypothetical protein